jgi:hypothetical protein
VHRAVALPLQCSKSRFVRFVDEAVFSLRRRKWKRREPYAAWVCKLPLAPVQFFGYIERWDRFGCARIQRGEMGLRACIDNIRANWRSA